MSKVNKGRQDIHGHGNREGKSSVTTRPKFPSGGQDFHLGNAKRIVAIKL